METYEYTPPAKEPPKKDAPDSKPTDHLIKPSQQHMTDLGLDADGKTELAKQLAKMRARSIPTGYPEEEKSKSILNWFDRDLIIKIIIIGVTAFVAFFVAKTLIVPLGSIVIEQIQYMQQQGTISESVGTTIQTVFPNIWSYVPTIVVIWIIINYIWKQSRLMD